MTGRASASASAASSSERTAACEQPLPGIEVRPRDEMREPDERQAEQQPERRGAPQVSDTTFMSIATPHSRLQDHSQIGRSGLSDHDRDRDWNRDPSHDDRLTP